MSQQQLEKLVDLLRKRVREKPYRPGPMRAEMDLLGTRFPPPEDAVVQRTFARGVNAEWVSAPNLQENRAILYLHGGGYVIGSPHSHRNLAYHLAKQANAPVLVVDYRLAPEHPFPAAVEDAVKAWRSLLEQGFEPHCLGIAGDSAGGGLAVAAQLQIRNEGLPLPAASVCISPWTDMAGTGDSITGKADEDPMVKEESLRWMAEQYMAGAVLAAPLASPIHADLSGLPPMLIQVGSAEILLDDARRLAARAGSDGVEVSLRVWENMVHVWHLFQPMLSEADDALAEAGQWFDEKLASS